MNSGTSFCENCTPRSLVIAGIVLACLVISVYAKSWSFDFLVFDDRLHVYGNEEISRGLGKDGLAWALTTFDKPYYMPLTRLSLMLDATVFGMEPEVFRITNSVIHFANALLLYLVVVVITGRAGCALAVAALFAVHPQHVEAVAWISQRKEVLAAFFGLLSLLFYIRYIAEKASVDRVGSAKASRAYAFSLLGFLLCLSAKPTWISLPVLLVLIDYLYSTLRQGVVRIRIVDKTPFLVIALSILVVHVGSAGYGGRVNPSISLDDVALFTRVLNASVIYLVYLATSLVPFWSSIYFPYPEAPFPFIYYLVSGLVLLWITLIVARRWHTKPYLLFGWAWFIVALVPVIGLTGTGEAVMIGDRWTYLPHIGLLIAGVMLFDESLPRDMVRLRTAVSVSICVAFACISWLTTHAWQSDEAYWKRTLEKTEANHFAHFQMSDVQMRLGNDSMREWHLEQALAAKPHDSKYLLNIVIHLQNQGRVIEAQRYLETIISTDDIPITYATALGQISLLRGDLNSAYRLFAKAARERPDSLASQDAVQRARFNIAVIYSLLGEDDKASEVVNQVVDVDPYAKAAVCRQLDREMGSFPPGFDLATVRGQVRDACGRQ